MPTSSKEKAEPVQKQNSQPVNIQALPTRTTHSEARARVWDKLESEANVYRLMESIGEGGYGEVFMARVEKRKTSAMKDSAELWQDVAVKIEGTRQNQTIIFDIQVLKEAAARRCKHIPMIFDWGKFLNRPDLHFVAMELKGRDLYQLRKEHHKFSLRTAITAGIHCLEALNELHDCGYIHRDVKPGNFVIGSQVGNDMRNIYLIDFGLVKPYMDQNGNILASRGEVGWRGTNRYGSLQAHMRLDLGRKDDMESWLYSVVELTSGALPWAAERDREKIFEKKRIARNNLVEFLAGCPPEYAELLMLIDQMNFSDAPNYIKLRQILEKVINDNQIDTQALLDWEVEEERPFSSENTEAEGITR